MSFISILREVESKVAKYIGVKHAIVCSSSRNAILFSLLAVGIGHKDEVVIPDFACQILPITVFCTGAQPRFCDVDKKTCAMTSESLKKALQPNTKAAILIHPLGLPANVFEIKELTQQNNIFLIEDAAQSLGASIKNRKTGSFGDIGILSFYKFLNCNLGGAALTNDTNIANKIRKIRDKKEKTTTLLPIGYQLAQVFKLNTKKNMLRLLWLDSKIAKQIADSLKKKHVRKINQWMMIDKHILKNWQSSKLDEDIINQLLGYDGSYWHRRKMTKSELQLLNIEFSNLEIYLKERRKIAKKYDDLLEDGDIHKIPKYNGSDPSYLRYPILVNDEERRNKLQKILKNMDFNPQHYAYRPLHNSPFFSIFSKDTSFPGSSYISKRILPLPTDLEDGQRLSNKIISVINKNNATN